LHRYTAAKRPLSKKQQELTAAAASAAAGASPGSDGPTPKPKKVCRAAPSPLAMRGMDDEVGGGLYSC
jgi:hypothetical protein